MKFEYTTDIGSLTIYGSATGDFRIVKVDGLGAVTPTRSVFACTGYDGQSETSRRIPYRTITLRTELIRSGNTNRRLAEVLSILSRVGVLTVENGSILRRITVNQTKIEIAEENPAYFVLALQMVCDNPHFEDCFETTVGICSRNKLLSSRSSLPCMFSERSNTGEVINSGDFAAEPIITIIGGVPNGTQGYIEIGTPDCSIVLNHTLSMGEEVILDIPKRTVTSSICGNLLNSLSYESYLSDMLLKPGTTEVFVKGYGANSEMSVAVTFKNKYLEAVG